MAEWESNLKSAIGKGEDYVLKLKESELEQLLDARKVPLEQKLDILVEYRTRKGLSTNYSIRVFLLIIHILFYLYSRMITC